MSRSSSLNTLSRAKAPPTATRTVSIIESSEVIAAILAPIEDALSAVTPASDSS